MHAGELALAVEAALLKHQPGVLVSDERRSEAMGLIAEEFARLTAAGYELGYGAPKMPERPTPWEPYLTLCREFIFAWGLGEGRGKALDALEEAFMARRAARKL